MSERGICSRREADRYIELGLVKVDGSVISALGTKVSPNATIELLPKAQKQQENKVTIILNKPIGYVSTQPEKGYKEAIELINEENQYLKGAGKQRFQPQHLKKLAVAGRLDIDSKGLLLFTQDGSLVKSLIGEDSSIEKEYLVRVEGVVTKVKLQKLTSGMKLDGKLLKRAKIDLLQPNLLRVVLQEGKKRQIRRMCEFVGLKVTQLKRVRIGDITLGDLPEGKWRYI